MAYNESGLFEKKLRNHSSFFHAQKHLNYWTDIRNVAAEKVVLGVPFYGWYNEFDLAGELLEKRSISFSYVNKHFHNLAEKDNLVEIATDTRKIVFTFNGVDLIAQKTQLSKDYGGIMIWHIGQDSDDLKLLRTVADNLQYKPENIENNDVSDDLTTTDTTNDIEIIIHDEVSVETKAKIEKFFANGEPTEKNTSTYGITCTLLGHKIECTSISTIEHKVRTTSPRCLKKTYDYEECTRCDYEKATLVYSSYIVCCS